jgi:hypothetical protein
MNDWYNNYCNYLSIPDSWSTIEEYANWYMNSKMPIHIPADSEVYRTEFSTSIILFRHNKFQTELYLTMPNATAKHSHPGIDITQCQIGPLSSNILLGQLSTTLYSNQYHQPNFENCKLGSVFLAHQYWHSACIKMCSATIVWKGCADGPEHIKLIKKYKPNIFIGERNYVDITREL